MVQRLARELPAKMQHEKERVTAKSFHVRETLVKAREYVKL